MEKVIMPLGEGFDKVKVSGVLSYESCKDLEREKIEEFIFGVVENRMKKFVDDDYPDKVEVNAEFVYIDHFYDKKGEISFNYEYSTKEGLKRTQKKQEEVYDNNG